MITITGDLTKRIPHYSLGDLALGRQFDIGMIVANHSLLPCQVPIQVRCEVGRELTLALSEVKLEPLASGAFTHVRFQLGASVLSGPGRIRLSLEQADQRQQFDIRYDSIFDASKSTVKEASIRRYPGACRSAFAWRGDMDLLDDVSGQSIEGLTRTLGLAARYRFPQTMFLSTRLSLDPDEIKTFYDHFGVSRGQERVAEFIEWLKSNVELRHEFTYPFQFDKPFALELGNHMHLHYGTEAAAAPENKWRLWAQMGAGVYPWQGEQKDSYSEQRDNALQARRLMEQKLGFSPKSWAMPDSTNDVHTPRAMAAAGCIVLSDSDSSHRHNVIFQPPPHHPKGTRAVELTKRYPGDPQDFIHLAMNHFWIHRARRLGIPVIFMSHQHLHLYEGYAGTRFTEAVMRHVLTRLNGDLHINTVFGVGSYWLDALNPDTCTLQARMQGSTILVENKGVRDWRDVPLDLEYVSGQKSTVLVNLPAGQTCRIRSDCGIELVN